MALTEAQVVIYICFLIKYIYIDQSAICFAYSFHVIHEYTLFSLIVSSIGTHRTMGPQDCTGTTQNDYNTRATKMNQGSIPVVHKSDRYTCKVMIIVIISLAGCSIGITKFKEVST